jgi:hypothetical protein
MLPSDIRSLQEAYQSIYEESDLLTDDLIEEIVEELVEECLEFGYDLDESADAVEAAAILYIDEAKVTYGSDTISPEDRRAEAKARLSDRKTSARKAAVKGAVDRVKSTAKGVKAAAGIAGSIAKDEVRRAGRTASQAVQKKKAEVKGGIKKMIGGGLRAAAGGLGKIAQRAAGAASKFGEEVELGENRRMARDPEGRKSGHSKQPDPSKPGFTGIGNMSIAQIAKMSAKIGKDKKQNEEVEIYDVVLEYLMSEGHADTIAEAEYIMTELDSEIVDQILETRMDPRGRPASGPMNVYAKSKPNTDPAFQAALKSYREKEAKKTPEQRKAELDAYKARQMNR